MVSDGFSISGEDWYNHVTTRVLYIILRDRV
jgi:hypothetical protein